VKNKKIFIGFVLALGLILFSISGEQAVAQADISMGVPTDQLIIKYKSEANLDESAQAQAGVQMQRLSNAAGVSLDYFRPMSGEAHVLKLPERMSVKDVQQIAVRLSALPEVEYAEPDYIMFAIEDIPQSPLLVPNDPGYTDQWHYFAPTAGNYGVNAPSAWDLTTGSSGIYVAVLDTGILNHADLSGRWTGGYDMISDDLVANDGDGRDNNPQDPGDWITLAESSSGYFAGCRVTNSSWHGTHVAGTISAATNNSSGVAGLNWVSQIVPVRVLGKCGGYLSDIADGIRWAAGLPVTGVPANAYPAQVINMSLGGGGTCEATYQNAITDVYNAGATIVVAAGNESMDAGGFRPANCNNVITVAATDRYGDQAHYSNFGSVVEISAPGGDTRFANSGVLSTLNDGTTGPGNDNYVYYQGTSMAAPHVAGVASLMYSLNPSLSPAQVSSILQNNVTSFPGGSTCNTSICGSGIVNAAAALAAVPDPVPVAPTLDAISNPDGDGDFLVNWNDVPDATSYTLLVDDNSSFSSPTTAFSGSASQYNVTGQAPGTWYYRVRASNSSGDGAWSNTVSVDVKPDPPTLNPIVNPGSLDAYTTDWSVTAGADGYLLQEADNPSFTGASTRYMGANTQYDVTGQAGGTWYYRVNAYADSVDSDWSNVVTTTVTTSYLNAPLLAPIDNADEDGDYTVAWSAVVSATSYILEESDNQYFVNPIVVYSGTMTQTNIIEQDGGTWYYRVRASDGVENSPWSNSRSVDVAEITLVFLPVVMNNFEVDYGFNSQFTNNANGWVTHLGSWVLNGGYYRTVGVPDYGSSISYDRVFTKLNYQARLYRTGCQDCSNRLFVHGTPDPLSSSGIWNAQYLFQYTASGYFSVFKVVGSNVVTLMDWTASSTINTGDAWNTVGVLVVDGYIYYYMNGTMIAAGPVEPDLTSGRVGIGMYRSSSSIGDQFDVDWATLTTIVSPPTMSIPAWSDGVIGNQAGSNNLDFYIP
jgi:serine protease